MLSVYIITVLSVVSLSIPVFAASEIEKDWAELTSEATLNLVHFGQKSYYIGGILKGTYHQAEQFCRYHGMHSLSIESQEENDFIQEKIIQLGVAHERFYTSGTRLPDGTHWIWMSTGRPMIFTNWYPGEPNDVKEYDEKCVEIRVVDRKLTWNDVNCTREFNIICEIAWPKDCYRLLQTLNSTKEDKLDLTPNFSLIDIRTKP